MNPVRFDHVDETIPSIQRRRHVISIVYHAFITLCGHEFIKGRIKDQDCICGCCSIGDGPSGGGGEDDDDENNKDSVQPHKRIAVQQWRQELYQLVQNTITFRQYHHNNNNTIDDNDNDVVTDGDHCRPPLERTKLYDIEIRTAMAYYQRYRNKESTTLSSSSSSSILTIVSDMGVKRTIHTAYSLAYIYLLPMIESQLQQCHISNHVRVATSSGFICCISRGRMQQIRRLQQQQYPSPPSIELEHNVNRHRHCSKKSSSAAAQSSILHWVSCPYCPLWCHTNKGLWWHLQQQHSMLYHTATETATVQCSRDSTAIIVYHSNHHHHHHHHHHTSNTNNNNNHNPCSNDENHCTEKAVTSTTPQQQPPSSVSTVSMSNTCIHQPTTMSFNDPWKCLQQNGTLLQFVQCLNQQPASFDCGSARDSYGAVLLHWAAGNGRTDIVQYLVEQQLCPMNIPQMGKRSYTGRTPLHWAARNGHYDTVHYILQYASRRVSSQPVADPTIETQRLLHECMEAKTADGTTPFCWASWQGHMNILQLLYDYGCPVDTVNKYGCNAILWAAQHPPPPPNDDDACDNSDVVVHVLQWLLDMECPYLVVNHSGHGVLHKGAQRGSRDVCTWYLNQLTRTMNQQQQQENGTWTVDFITTILNVFGPNNDDCTPSDLAGMEHHIELARYLLEQEQEFVQCIIGTLLLSLKSTSSSSSDLTLYLPPWLSPLPPGTIHRYHTNQPDVWEPGAGVFRMRSVLSDILMTV